jgi:3-oxo-5alpha-steroid 4-dehydrogenase
MRAFLDGMPARLEKLRTAKHTAVWEPTGEYDIIVVGFGCAGACAALEAASHGKRVLLVDRFTGGGSTKRSGGVLYAGGGTRAQKEVGIEDDPENMFRYVRQENGGAVDDSTIRQFCEDSAENFAWLEQVVGVPFVNADGKSIYYAQKTSYPPSFATLYSSGNEAATGWREAAKPGNILSQVILIELEEPVI